MECGSGILADASQIRHMPGVKTIECFNEGTLQFLKGEH